MQRKFLAGADLDAIALAMWGEGNRAENYLDLRVAVEDALRRAMLLDEARRKGKRRRRA